MVLKFRSVISNRLVPGALVVGLGLAFLVATGAAHADNGGGAPCVLGGVMFLDGNTGEIDGITYTCNNGTMVEIPPPFPNGTPTPLPSLKRLPSMVEGHAYESNPSGITAGSGALRSSNLRFGH